MLEKGAVDDQQRLGGLERGGVIEVVRDAHDRAAVDIVQPAVAGSDAQLLADGLVGRAEAERLGRAAVHDVLLRSVVRAVALGGGDQHALLLIGRVAQSPEGFAGHGAESEEGQEVVAHHQHSEAACVVLALAFFLHHHPVTDGRSGQLHGRRHSLDARLLQQFRAQEPEAPRDVDRLRLHDEHGRLPSAHLRAAYPPHLPRDAHTDDRHEKHNGILPNKHVFDARQRHAPTMRIGLHAQEPRGRHPRNDRHHRHAHDDRHECRAHPRDHADRHRSGPSRRHDLRQPPSDGHRQPSDNAGDHHLVDEHPTRRGAVQPEQLVIASVEGEDQSGVKPQVEEDDHEQQDVSTGNEVEVKDVAVGFVLALEVAAQVDVGEGEKHRALGPRIVRSAQPTHVGGDASCDGVRACAGAKQQVDVGEHARVLVRQPHEQVGVEVRRLRQIFIHTAHEHSAVGIQSSAGQRQLTPHGRRLAEESAGIAATDQDLVGRVECRAGIAVDQSEVEDVEEVSAHEVEESGQVDAALVADLAAVGLVHPHHGLNAADARRPRVGRLKAMNTHVDGLALRAQRESIDAVGLRMEAIVTAFVSHVGIRQEHASKDHRQPRHVHHAQGLAFQ